LKVIYNFQGGSMRAGMSLTDWTAALKETFSATLHQPLSKALASFSLAMAQARSCCLMQVAMCLASSALISSSTRRLERLLANEHLDVTAVYQALACALASSRRGGRLVLIIDESDRSPKLRSLQILAAVKHRCLPLFAQAYHPKHPPAPMNRYIPASLELLAGWLKDYDLQITLLADRGLSWPLVVQTCQKLGWHYVLRLQGQTRIKTAEGKQKSLAKLLGERVGIRALDELGVFKKAGWISEQSITAVRVRGCKSPWYLLSDRPAGEHQVSRYAMRMWAEQSFRDQKSSGLNWRSSRVNNPAHATRLLVIMALSMWLCLLVGMGLVRRGWRRYIQSRRQRMYSYFKLGLIWLTASVHRDLPALNITLEGI
jgi:hypothetical protein